MPACIDGILTTVATDLSLMSDRGVPISVQVYTYLY